MHVTRGRSFVQHCDGGRAYTLWCSKRFRVVATAAAAAHAGRVSPVWAVGSLQVVDVGKQFRICARDSPGLLSRWTKPRSVPSTIPTCPT